MKILHIGNVNNVENYTKKTPFTESAEVVNAPLGLTDEAYAGLAPDAEMIIVDAITEISEKLIEKLPDLKLIHSEGVAFNRINNRQPHYEQSLSILYVLLEEYHCHFLS